MFEGGGKHDERTRLRQRRGQRRAADFRHLHVEEHEVRPQVANRHACFVGVAGFADDGHVPGGIEQLTHPHARRRLVVHEHRADHAATLTFGIEIRATVMPVLSSRVRPNDARSPKWPPNRSRTLRSPKPSPPCPERATAETLSRVEWAGPVFRTSSVTCSGVVRTITSMRPGPRAWDTPCLTAFSSKVWSSIDGTSGTGEWWSESMVQVSRWPKRACSTSRYARAKVSSWSSGAHSESERRSV